MSDFAFQETLVKLMTDAKTRQLVYAGNVQALTELGYPADAVERLRSIDPERLEVFADMVIAQRLSDIKQILPYTAQLLGNRLYEILLEYNHDIKPSYSTKQEQALAFAKFLKGQFLLQPPSPPFLEDMLTYELAALELFGKRNETQNIKNDIGAQLHQEERRPFIVPYRLDTSQVVSLRYDIAEVGRELKEDRIPVAPPERPMLVLLRVNRLGLIEKDEINSTTLAFIEACDGEASLSRVIADLAPKFRQDTPALFPGFEQKCVGLCESLVERLVIGLRQPA